MSNGSGILSIIYSVIAAFIYDSIKVIEGFINNIPIVLWTIILLFMFNLGWLILNYRSSFLNRGSLHLKGGFSSTVFKSHLSLAKELYILNTFAPNFDDRLKDILLQALYNGIYVKVALWDPGCTEVKYRAETLPEWKENIIKETIQSNIDFLQQIYNEVQKTKNEVLLQLKLYDSWPPFSLYATDRGASVGFFMNGGLAVDGPQLVITTNEPYFHKFIKQFDKIWGTGKLFDLSKNDWINVLREEFSQDNNSNAT
jgi:hypothetical protein